MGKDFTMKPFSNSESNVSCASCCGPNFVCYRLMFVTSVAAGCILRDLANGFASFEIVGVEEPQHPVSSDLPKVLLHKPGGTDQAASVLESALFARIGSRSNLLAR